MVNSTFALLAIIGILALVCVASPYLAIAIPILIPFYYLFMRIYLASSKQLQRLESASKSPLYGLFATTVSALPVIRAFGAEGFFIAKNDALLDNSQGPMYFRYQGQNFLKVTLAWLTVGVAVRPSLNLRSWLIKFRGQSFLAISLSILVVALRGRTSAGLLGAGQSAASRSYWK